MPPPTPAVSLLGPLNHEPLTCLRSLPSSLLSSLSFSSPSAPLLLLFASSVFLICILDRLISAYLCLIVFLFYFSWLVFLSFNLFFFPFSCSSFLSFLYLCCWFSFSFSSSSPFPSPFSVLILINVYHREHISRILAKFPPSPDLRGGGR